MSEAIQEAMMILVLAKENTQDLPVITGGTKGQKMTRMMQDGELIVMLHVGVCVLYCIFCFALYSC